MTESTDLAGAAHLVLAQGVVHLDPEPAVFSAMIEGWARQQRTRFLNYESTIKPRLSVVRRLADFSSQYPWQWQPAEAEAFFDFLRARRPNFAVSTARNYQNALRMFCEYVTDERYEWPRVCLDRFGRQPVQILHEWNSITHTSTYEGSPGRRPLSYDEVQLLFDAADEQVETIRRRGRKGALAALRDAVMLKAVYAYGLRRQEACGLDLVDLRRNSKTPSYGKFGGVFVRFGKASKGGPPKRRTVLTVPEMDWVVDVLADYLSEVRGGFAPGRHPALWVTERRGRVSLRGLNGAFTRARELAELPEELDLHSLRHSYVTHLIEFGYPERFVQEQVGHAYASTTAIYTGVSDDYRNRLLERALKQRHGDLWEEPA